MSRLDFVEFFPYIIIAVMGAIVLGVVYADKRRKNKIKEIAEKSGFEYDFNGDILIGYIGSDRAVPEERSFVLNKYSDDVSRYLYSTGISLFDNGHSKKTKNIISFPFKNSKIFLFDYYYTVGSGKNSTTYSQTVAFYKSDKKFPSFSMRPENFFDTITSLVGYNDIDFNEFPSFSKLYYLKSKDEATVKEFFSEHRIRFFEQTPGWYLEANENFIVLYKKGLVSVDKYQQHIDEVTNIFNSLDI